MMRFVSKPSPSTILQNLIGLFFLFSASAKALSPDVFALQIRAYDLVTSPRLLIALAFVVIMGEWLLGGALLLLHRPAAARKSVLVMTLMTLLGFTGLVAWGWVSRDLEECGCFGSLVAMRPVWSLSKNLLLIALVVGLMWSARKSGGALSTQTLHKRLILLVLSALLPLGVTLTAHQAATRSETASGKTPTERPETLAQIRFEGDGGVIDLAQGTWLVAFLSPDCPHCIETLPTLNKLAQDDALPPVAGIIPKSATSLSDFSDRHSLMFPLTELPSLTFYHFVPDAPPYFIVIKNGQIRAEWPKTPPMPLEILGIVE
jgi:thiol-disulfide isomerase/thioredoxin